MKGIFDSTGIAADVFASLFNINVNEIPVVHIVDSHADAIEGEYVVDDAGAQEAGGSIAAPYSPTLPQVK